MSERLIAIGDVHGCAAALEALLEAIDPRASDLVVALGDYVDRGPDSRGVIEMLLALAQRCRFVPLLGNHEEMLLRAIDDVETRHGWMYYGGLETLESYGSPSGPEALPPEHLAFLESCLDYYETDSHFFVHASYDPDTPLDQQSVYTRRWHSLRDGIPGPHRSGKVAVVGHTSQKDGEILNIGHLICIDTFCYGGGWLTALEVRSGRVWQADMSGELRDRQRPPE